MQDFILRVVIDKVRNQPRTTQEYQKLLSVEHYAIITKKAPLFKSSDVQAPLKLASKHLDDPEQEWEKVMWSNETKIKVFSLNFTYHHHFIAAG